MMTRADLLEPMTPMQYVIVSMLGLNLSHSEIAAELTISQSTVRYHLYKAVAKIPGDLPAEQRAVAWARGADIEVLEGTGLKLEFLNRATSWTDSYSRRSRTHTLSGA